VGTSTLGLRQSSIAPALRGQLVADDRVCLGDTAEVLDEQIMQTSQYCGLVFQSWPKGKAATASTSGR
jgi:hypothetical protein